MSEHWCMREVLGLAPKWAIAYRGYLLSYTAQEEAACAKPAGFNVDPSMGGEALDIWLCAEHFDEHEAMKGAIE